MTQPSKHKTLNNYLDGIINNIPHYIFWKDNNSIFIGCNKKFAEYLGLSKPDDIIGKTDIDMPWGKSFSKKYIKDDQEILFNGVAKLDYEEKQTHPDGTERIVLVNKVPIKSSSQKIIGILCIYTDVTEKKEREKKLKETLKQVETLSSAKSEFIANMSHDVKTPLSGILGLTEILKQKSTNPEHLEIINSMQLAGQQLTKLFDSCINLANPNESSPSIVKQPFNLHELLNKLNELFKPAIQSKGLEFNLNCDSDVPNYLLGCQPALYRILLNLIGNAIKFTHKGSIEINVSLGEKSNKRNPILEIMVRDTGIGIPTNKQKTIFERFTRLTPSSQGIYEGNGIGLYVVNSFIKAMNGEIHIHSQENIGSKFFITIPFEVPLLNIKQAHIENKTTPPPAIAKKTPGIIPYLQKDSNNISKILIIEDNPLALKIISSLLTTLSCKIVTATNGKQALTLFEPGDFDCIFLDLGLPDFPGTAIAEIIKKIEKHKRKPHTPIIALTAHINNSLEADCTKIGINYLLEKPITLKKAKQIIDQHIIS